MFERQVVQKYGLSKQKHSRPCIHARMIPKRLILCSLQQKRIYIKTTKINKSLSLIPKTQNKKV